MAARRAIYAISKATVFKPRVSTIFFSSVLTTAVVPVSQPWSYNSRSERHALSLWAPFAAVGIAAFYQEPARSDDPDPETEKSPGDKEESPVGDAAPTAFTQAKPEFKSHPGFLS